MSRLCGSVDFRDAGEGRPPGHAIRVLLDGRLDNRADLIARLRPAEGAAASDTELLLVAYLEWGEACTDHLLGDFAFAVWDAPARRLLCAVDPLGMKPLHYVHRGPFVAFASDAFQVLQHAGGSAEYDEGEIAGYLASQIEHPERSFFKSVRRLAPAQRLIATPDAFRVERYWQPSPGEIVYHRDEDYAEHFRDLFQRAVTDRLRTRGGSVAVAMSGGLDSTSVAAVAHRSRHETGKSVYAYTFGFDRLAGCDERAWSGAMTEELGLPVETVEAESFWNLDPGSPLAHSPDTPFVGWRTCYAEIFRRMSGRGARVLLMGHGGDDLLRGSALVYAERLRRGDLGAVREAVRHARDRREAIPRALYRCFGRPFLPAVADRLLRSAFGRPQEALLPAWVAPDFERRAGFAGRQADLRPPRVFASPARQEVYANLIATPWYWRLANWHDRNAASFGIEVRHPFLDRRLFEYVQAIPGEQLFRLDSTKNLLRRAMAGLLPERIRTRPGKTRFASFLDSVLRHGEVQEILSSPRSAVLGILDKEKLQASYRDFLRGADGERRALWHTVNLEIWLRRCEALIQARSAVLPGRAAA